MSARSARDLILPRVASGDPRAVDDCIDRFGALVWSMTLRMEKDRDIAEDMVQEIFLAIWKSADRYDPERASESTFIATIARRKLIDSRRKADRKPRTESIDQVEIGASDESLQRVDISDEASRAARALQQLKPEQRRVLLLSIQDGLSHSQIAEVTQLPLGTVKSHVRRGLERVARMLEVPSAGRTEEVSS